ncbi:MAG: patatin-like phospholipase family protein [Verrucomicrobiales bacterium]
MKVGLALGGGGVRGLAHISLLRVLEEEGIVPTAIAGTSMGSLIGTWVARGRKSDDIREWVERHVFIPEHGLSELWKKGKDLSHWLGFFRPTLGKGAFISADGFLDFLLKELEIKHFDDLPIPFHAVAADFHTFRKVVFTDGPLKPALKASMAIPGVFEAVKHQGRLLVDGGIADNVPWSVLDSSCDAVIAIDVADARHDDDHEPDAIETFVSTFQRMIARNTIQRRAIDPPTLYFRPSLRGIQGLDLGRIPEVLAQAETETERFRAALRDAFPRNSQPFPPQSPER